MTRPQPLTAVPTSEGRRRDIMRASDYRCTIGECHARAAYITEDGRAACGRCATSTYAAIGVGNAC